MFRIAAVSSLRFSGGYKGKNSSSTRGLEVVINNAPSGSQVSITKRRHRIEVNFAETIQETRRPSRVISKVERASAMASNAATVFLVTSGLIIGNAGESEELGVSNEN